MSAHTIDEALGRFSLISGAGSETDNKACVMTALSWVAGEAWTDHPDCAHRLLADLAIRANDADATTPEQRAELVRAGEHGLIDTWWVPTEVILASLASSRDDDPVAEVLGTITAVAAWKTGDKARPNLRFANLRSANLRFANLGSADLRFADLRFADLHSANLGSADLRFANLRSADLGSADLRFADLHSANLRSANLGSADLRSADLRFADLRFANLRSANLGSANLRSANLGSANLGSANLGSADLRFADLGSADLRFADLHSANLGSARGVPASGMPKGWRLDSDGYWERDQ